MTRKRKIVMLECRDCKQLFEQIQYVNGVKRDYRERKRCPTCLPHKSVSSRSHTENLYKIEDGIKYKFCKKCQIYKIGEKYSINKKGRWSTYCKECYNSGPRELKQELVKYKGGCCEFCGYNKCISALDFHHKDPKEKEFNFSDVVGVHMVIPEKIYREADKCLLLCSNCHREEHERFRIIDRIEKISTPG